VSAAGVDAIWDEPRAGHMTAGTFGQYLDGQVSTAAGTPLTAAAVWAHADRTLTAATNITSTGGAVAVNASGQVAASTVIDKTGYALTAAYDPAKTAAQPGDPMGLTAMAVGAIWDEDKASHAISGTFGDLLDAKVSGAGGESGLTAADVWAHPSRSLTSAANLTTTGSAIYLDPSGYVTAGAVGDKTGFALTAAYDAAKTAAQAGAAMSLTTATIDAIWDESLAGHALAGSAGSALSAAGSSGDPWATVLPGTYAAGTAGAILGRNLDAAGSTT
jgi:hypothetical protein